MQCFPHTRFTWVGQCGFIKSCQSTFGDSPKHSPFSLTEQQLIGGPLGLILKDHFLLISQYFLFPLMAVLNIFQLLFQVVSHPTISITPPPTRL